MEKKNKTFKKKIPRGQTTRFASFGPVLINTAHVKETYGRGSECMEDGRDGRDGRIGATKYAGGNGTRKRGGKAERITQG